MLFLLLAQLLDAAERGRSAELRELLNEGANAEFKNEVCAPFVDCRVCSICTCRPASVSALWQLVMYRIFKNYHWLRLGDFVVCQFRTLSFRLLLSPIFFCSSPFRLYIIFHRFTPHFEVSDRCTKNTFMQRHFNMCCPTGVFVL